MYMRDGQQEWQNMHLYYKRQPLLRAQMPVLGDGSTLLNTVYQKKSCNNIGMSWSTSIYTAAIFESSQLVESLAMPTITPSKTVNTIPIKETLMVFNTPTKRAFKYVSDEEKEIIDSPISKEASLERNPNPVAMDCFSRFVRVFVKR